MTESKSVNGTEVWTSERQLFKAVTESTTLIAWATDVFGSCYYLSPEWYRFTGRTTEEGEGFNWLQAIHDEDRDMVRKAFFAAHDSQTAYGVAYRLTRPSGVYNLCWAVGLPKFDEGGFQGFFGTIFPIEMQHYRQLALAEPLEGIRSLSNREREVLRLIAEGDTAEVVASKLGITRRTVETHVANAGVKLGGLNRTHTVVRAVRLNEI